MCANDDVLIATFMIVVGSFFSIIRMHSICYSYWFPHVSICIARMSHVYSFRARRKQSVNFFFFFFVQDHS